MEQHEKNKKWFYCNIIIAIIDSNIHNKYIKHDILPIFIYQVFFFAE